MYEFFIKFLNSPIFGLSLVFAGILIVHACGYFVWRYKVNNARLNQEEWKRMVSLSNGKKSEVYDENKDVLSDLRETSEDLKFRMKIWEIEDKQRKEFREAVSKLMKAAGRE